MLIAQGAKHAFERLALHAKQDFAMLLMRLDQCIAERGGQRIAHALV